MSDQARFWLNVDRRGPDECWDWLGRVDKQGRGRFFMQGKSETAPRACWILTKGPIQDESLEVLHECDRPVCCGPHHLRLGTKTENMQDMARKGRAGIQQHPERYVGCRPRRPDVKYRPVKQSMVPRPIDHRTWTRLATVTERDVARRALHELETQHNRIQIAGGTVDGRRLRVQVESNPDWYRAFGKAFWRGPRSFQLKRCRVEQALHRVAGKGRVRGNGYERQLLSFLVEFYVEADRTATLHTCEKQPDDGVRAMMKVGENEWADQTPTVTMKRQEIQREP